MGIHCGHQEQSASMDFTDTPGDRVVRGLGSSCGSGIAAIRCASALIPSPVLTPPALLVDRGLLAASLSFAALSRPTLGFPPALLDGGPVTIFHFGCIGSISRRGKGNSLRGQPACAGTAVTLTERRLSLPMERWPSGRRRSPAKRVGGVKPPRGFKSLPLRCIYLVGTPCPRGAAAISLLGSRRRTPRRPARSRSDQR